MDTPGEKDEAKSIARPNKTEFDAKIVALNDEVQDFNERLSEVDTKIAEAKSSGGDQSEELREARATMKSLRERKDAIMRDRAEIAALQKSAKASLDSKITVYQNVISSKIKYSGWTVIACGAKIHLSTGHRQTDSILRKATVNHFNVAQGRKSVVKRNRSTEAVKKASLASRCK
jgi:chromosome segregation ATPase